MSNLDSKIDQFKESIANDFLERSDSPGVDVWPQPVFNPLLGNGVIYPDIYYRYSQIFESLDHKGYTIEDFADLFHYPGRTIHQMYLFMHRATSKEEALLRRSLANTFIQVLEEQREGDPFCRDGKNRLQQFSKSDVSIDKFQTTSRIPNENPERLISELNVLLSGYMELLFFANLSYGREFHGPYEYCNDEILVRDFYDFTPNYYEFCQDFPYDNMRIVSRYDDGTGITFDIAGRMNSKDSLKDNLKEFYVVVEGDAVKPSDLPDLVSEVREIVDQISTHVKELSRTELITAWVEKQYYVTKPFIDELGAERYKPPSYIYDRISEPEVDQYGREVINQMGRLPELNSSQAHNLLEKIFDPCRWGDSRQNVLNDIS